MGLDCLLLLALLLAGEAVIVVSAETESDLELLEKAEEGLDEESTLLSQQASNETAFFIRVSSLEVKIPSSAN